MVSLAATSTIANYKLKNNNKSWRIEYHISRFRQNYLISSIFTALFTKTQRFWQHRQHRMTYHNRFGQELTKIDYGKLFLVSPGTSIHIRIVYLFCWFFIYRYFIVSTTELWTQYPYSSVQSKFSLQILLQGNTCFIFIFVVYF